MNDNKINFLKKIFLNYFIYYIFLCKIKVLIKEIFYYLTYHLYFITITIKYLINLFITLHYFLLLFIL